LLEKERSAGGNPPPLQSGNFELGVDRGGEMSRDDLPHGYIYGESHKPYANWGHGGEDKARPNSQNILPLGFGVRVSKEGGEAPPITEKVSGGFRGLPEF